MDKKMKTTASKSTRTKRRKSPTDPFAVFKQSTAAAFSFLVDDLGFKEVATRTHPPECEIKYQNNTTGVTVTYEWGGALWVDLTRLARKRDEVVEAEKYSLDVLMMECLPNRDINQFRRLDVEAPDQHVNRVLLEYAQILKDCGADILNGDFQLFPKLRKHAEDVLRQRNEELFN
jgi:hypothetical protein